MSGEGVLLLELEFRVLNAALHALGDLGLHNFKLRFVVPRWTSALRLFVLREIRHAHLGSKGSFLHLIQFCEHN